MNYLTENQAKDIVEKYISQEQTSSSTQEILDSGVVPRLKGYKVRPGKVSDSIFGGEFSYTTKSGKTFREENPPLNDSNGTPLRIMVRTERISTHDITRGEIPFKDQILAENHNYMRKLLRPVIGSSQYDVPGLEDNSVVIVAENLTQIPFENVLRAFMAKSSTSTSLYQHYIKGDRMYCGHKLSDNLIANGALPYVMDTPSTKSDVHDESVSPQYLFDTKICTPQQYNQIRNSSLVAFGIASQFLKLKGIKLVDTKLENGINKKGEIESQDEIINLDSSRFWLEEDYAEQLKKLKEGKIEELHPTSYSKEFARGFSEGEEDYNDEQRVKIAVRYIEGVQHLLSQPFQADMSPRDERVISGLQKIVDKIVK